ncbi:B2 bradykinin receptor-like [Oryzias melastigma]|uniref:B2 bradykinin receptor-like n=1 Tax=Oryzias melastigma TaxID=30732 RepID=UPI000CF80688|nr:B2 bradykinin receptor-like [Oryzias melastigma]
MSGIQNSTNPQMCSVGYAHWTFTVVPIYVMTIAVLGIVLNLFVLMVFILHKKACTVAEIYLGNLAAADLLLVSFLPFWAVYAYRYYNWTFGSVLCKIVNVSILMNVYCSIFFLVLVSIDRYFALVFPLSHAKLRGPVCAKGACLLVWVAGFLLSLPAIIHRDVIHHRGPNVTKCTVDSPSTTTLIDCMIFIFGFIIPVSIISFCTVKILKALRNRISEGLNTQKKDHKATTLVLAVLLAFLFCWVPFYLYKIPSVLRDRHILTDCTSKYILFISGNIFTYLAFFNSVLNPILYVIVGKNFRSKVKDLFMTSERDHRWSLIRSFLSRRIKSLD